MRIPRLFRLVALMLIGLLPVQGMAMGVVRTPAEEAPAAGREHATTAVVGHCDDMGAMDQASESSPDQPSAAGHAPGCHAHACCVVHAPPAMAAPFAPLLSAETPRAELVLAVASIVAERLPRPPRA